MIRRLAPLVVLAAGVAVAIPAQAAWNVVGTAAQTSNGKAGTINAPTAALPTCSTGTVGNGHNNQVKIDVTWTAPTSGPAPVSYNFFLDTTKTTGAATPFSTGWFTPTHSHTYNLTVVSVRSKWNSAASTARTVPIAANGNCGTPT